MYNSVFLLVLFYHYESVRLPHCMEARLNGSRFEMRFQFMDRLGDTKFKKENWNYETIRV